MATNITTIYDQLNTAISTLLVNYVQLPNPYAAIENPSLMLKKAYGLGFGAGANTNRLVCGQLSVSREMTVTLIQSVPSLVNQTAKLAEIEKNLLEDELLLIKFFESNDHLLSSISKIAFVADSGINYEQTGKGLFIMLDISIEVEYFENINT